MLGSIYFVLSICLGYILFEEQSKLIKRDKFKEIKIGQTYEDVINILGDRGNIVFEDAEDKIYCWFMGWYLKDRKKCYTTKINTNLMYTRERIEIKVRFKKDKVISKEEKGLYF